MFLVEIRGAARTVRKRTGEEVSDPDIDWEGNGGEGTAPATRSHDEFIPYMILQNLRPHARVQNEKNPEDAPAYVVGEAASTFTGDRQTEEDEAANSERQRSPVERLGASDSDALWARVLKNPRRFLMRLRAESSKRRIELTLSRPLQHGRAYLELVVSRGRMSIDASIELRRAATGLSALAARSQQHTGMVTRVAAQITGMLAEDGTWSEIEIKGFARNTRDASAEAAALRPRIERVTHSGAPLDDRIDAMRSLLEPLLGRERKALGLLLEILETQSVLQVEFEEDRRSAPRSLALPILAPVLAHTLTPDVDDQLETADIPVNPDRPALTWSGPREGHILFADDEEKGALGDHELARILALIPALLKLLSVAAEPERGSDV